MPLFRRLALALLCQCGLAAAQIPAPEEAPLWPSLSRAERLFLQQQPVVRIGVERDWPPIGFVGPDGLYAGLSADVLAAVSRISGLRFELTPRGDWQQVEQALRDGQVDLLPAIVKAPGREADVRYSRPYLEIFTVIITRDDSRYVGGLADLAGRTVSMPRGYASSRVFERDYPLMLPVPVRNVAEALEAVALGRAEATVMPLAVANSTIEQLGIPNLRIAAPVPELQQGLLMGSRRDLPALASVLDKALAAIPDAEMTEIRARWMGSLRAGERDILSRTEQAALAGILLLLLLTVLWALSLRREAVRRREAQDRAEQAEQRLRELAEGIPGAIWQFRREPDGYQHYSYMSDGIRRITGRSPQETNEIMKSRAFSAVHPDDIERLRALMQRLAAQGAIDEERYRLQTADGSWRWVQVAAKAHHEAGGALVWNGITLDASRLQEVEDELEAERHRMQELIDSVPGAVWRLRRLRDGQFRVEYVSEGVAGITGARASDHLGDAGRLLATLPSADRERLLGELARSALEGGLLQVEVRLPQDDGRAKHLFARANVSQDASGEPVWTGVLLDITERRVLEAALADAHARLDDIVANFPGAIWQMKRDPAGREFFTYLSDSITSITGRPAEATLTRPLQALEVIVEEDRDAARQSLYQAIDSPDPVAFDYRLRTASGELRWAHVTASARREPDGGVIWNGVILDASERKRLEVELDSARRAAEAASHAKSRFLANMSHEIRTPMNAVIGLSHLAIDAEQQPEQRERLDKINRAAKALLRLLNDILEFSKLEAGKLRLTPVPFVLAELLDGLRLLAGTPAAEKGLQFRIETDPALPERLVGDTLRLQQVLLNLLANATKFTDGGEICLRVRPDGGDRGPGLAFEISDTGIGMSEAQLARVFDAFEQADAATSRRHGGSGLGLSISLELVRLMGGELAVRSRPGEGSCFTVWLPLVLPETPEILREPGLADDEQALERRCRRLMEHLQGRDTAARGEALALRALLAAQGLEQDLDTLERQLSAYDFESAELELTRLAGRWGLPPLA